jgi:hypothetical protein
MADWLAWQVIEILAICKHRLAVYEEIMYPFGILVGFLIGGSVAECFGVEDNNIGIITNAQIATLR